MFDGQKNMCNLICVILFLYVCIVIESNPGSIRANYLEESEATWFKSI